MQSYEEIRQLIDRVRRRWRALRAFQAAARTALAVLVVTGLSLVASRWTNGAPLALAAIGVVAFGCLLLGILWGLLPLRTVPGDKHVARFIEEREPSLDDRLVSAVDVASRPAPGAAGFAEPMLADTARRLREVEIETIVPSETMRRAAYRAAAAALAAFALLFAARHTARQAVDAVALTLFPARVALDVTPGNARVRAGAGLGIQARLVGNTAPVAAQLQIAQAQAAPTTPASPSGRPPSGDESWRRADMVSDSPGSFHFAMDSVWASFKYRIVAGAVTSPTYEVTVVKPPHVARIDVDYVYPAALNLPPRTEKDSGDIYAPAGTDVRVHVTTDQPAATGQLSLASGQRLDLTSDAPNAWSASLKVTDDGSYRVALTDREGLSSPGDTEYFIRMLEDRPPDVHLLQPGSDRSVTRLEEVDIAAQAEDDYGIDRLDLVYSVRGEADHVVPLKIPRNETSVTGRHTLYLEDLDVAPGDFVSYYVRARDLTRGTHPHEARSDIFFLEVKPYEQEFAVAQSQTAAAGGGGRGTLDELIAAQKEVIVATWKLDRRAEVSKGGKSEQDVRSVARAQAELKTRVEQESSSFRESVMRDPRRRPQAPRGRGAPPAPPGPEPLKAGQTMPEEDEMTAAAEAMTEAATSLDALKTSEARAPEMEALNHLLRAQADVKKHDVMRQQAGSGAGSNRSNYDLSTLFDKELQKQQQTNYEMRSSAEERKDSEQSALDKIRDLARRQDELLKRQQELARTTMSEEALRRELEKLTREQSDLRQRAEELARQTAQQGQQGQRGQQGSSPPAANPESPITAGMRQASEAMRNATNDLRRQDLGQAAQPSAAGTRALDALRNLERQMQAAQPDDKRRAMGEMQLEARQLADAQRQVASELGKAGSGDSASDTLRRLAGEQGRLSDRARKLQEGLKRQTAGAEAGRDLERQKLADRMQQSADALRGAAERGQGAQRGTTAPASQSPAMEQARAQAASQQEMARALDRVAERMAAAGGAGKDGDSTRLSDQLARAQQLQERLDQLTEQMKRLGQQPGNQPGGPQSGSERGGQQPGSQPGGQQPGNPQSGSGQQGGQQAARQGSQEGGQGQGGQGQGGQSSPGESGRAGQGQTQGQSQGQGEGAGNGAGMAAARLREEARRVMQETRELMDQLRREDPSLSRGGAGFTFEGQGMTTTAPGTEAFKQDFAKWEDLRRQATTALENAQSAISKKLQAKESKERLAAGADDKAPAEYQKQVDDYFKAIATKKKG